jgi:lipopolysaccharide biosynthesis glycosyltransferase
MLFQPPPQKVTQKSIPAPSIEGKPSVHLFLYASEDFLPGAQKAASSACRHFDGPVNLILDVYLSAEKCTVKGGMAETFTKNMGYCAGKEVFFACGSLVKYAKTPAENELLAEASKAMPGEYTKDVRNRMSMLARLFYTRMFPGARYVFFLDSDLIVRDNLHKVMKETEQHPRTIGAAVRMKQRSFSESYDYKTCGNELLGNHDPRTIQFNSGFVYFDLARAKSRDLKSEGSRMDDAIATTISCSTRRLWDQDVLNLYAGRDMTDLLEKWNVYGLGAHPDVTYTAQDYKDISRELEEGSVWHWSGPCKPWHHEQDLMKCYSMFWYNERTVS